jgi:hypothetical protein
MYENLDYIGFMQYDMKVDPDMFASMEDDIRTARSVGKERIFVLETQPIVPVLSLEPCLVTHAIAHYNAFFGTRISVADLAKNPRSARIPMLHTFAMPVPMFEKMMRWLSAYMQKLEDNLEQYPFRQSQAEYAERLHGIFLAIEAFLRPEVQWTKITHMKHIWPVYHDQTQFDSYKKQTK